VVKKTHVIPASEMRRRLGLRPTQLLVLVLFDEDRLLETMWGREITLVQQLARAEYDLVTPPSFSTYTPRPRTEFLINVKRSMIYFEALQLVGAPTIPRLAWQVTHDVRRFAEWTIANPCVRRVALDWSTYRVSRDWDEQLDGLALFDSLTNQTLSYFINGVTTEDRCDALFDILSPERAHITNATTQAEIPTPHIRSTGDQTGARFNARLQTRRDVVVRAADRHRSPAQLAISA
jgi:hypothetical protein